MDLPEITEVQRFRYAPGDRFVVKVPGTVSQQMAHDIVRQLRYVLDLPDGTPVVVLADGWGLTIAGPGEPDRPQNHDPLDFTQGEYSGPAGDERPEAQQQLWPMS